MSRFKILLINPPWYRLFGQAFSYYPIGLCYLAGVLEQEGYDTVVYNADYNYRKLGDQFLQFSVRKVAREYANYERIVHDLSHPLWQEVKDVIREQSPSIVGITVMTAKRDSARNVAKLVKELDPGIPVVVGGVHPTIVPNDMLGIDEVDVVVRGEGEYTLLELVKALQAGEPLCQILGISYEGGDGIVHNPDRPLIQELDQLPFPARHLLLEKETYPSGGFGRVFASRGCPFHCTFCASHKIWTRRVRFRSPENVVEEIKQVRTVFGTRFFHFEDDSFSVSKKFVESLCDLLERLRPKVVWSCETRADLLTDDLAQKMKAAGCESIQIGVESGDEETLKQMEKGITLDEVRKAASIVKRNGLTLNAFFMVGFPEETMAQIERTVSFMKELDPDFAVYSIVTPYPGTKLYETCLSQHLIPESIDWSAFFHQSPDMFLNRRLNRDEISQVIKYTEEAFDKHNRRKAISRALGNPGAALKIVLTRGYWKPRFLLAMLRSVLGR